MGGALKMCHILFALLFNVLTLSGYLNFMLQFGTTTVGRGLPPDGPVSEIIKTPRHLLTVTTLNSFSSKLC